MNILVKNYNRNRCFEKLRRNLLYFAHFQGNSQQPMMINSPSIQPTAHPSIALSHQQHVLTASGGGMMAQNFNMHHSTPQHHQLQQQQKRKEIYRFKSNFFVLIIHKKWTLGIIRLLICMQPAGRFGPIRIWNSAWRWVASLRSIIIRYTKNSIFNRL